MFDDFPQGVSIVRELPMDEIAETGDVDPRQLAVKLDKIFAPLGIRLISTFNDDHGYYLVTDGEGESRIYTRDDIWDAERDVFEVLSHHLDIEDGLDSDVVSSAVRCIFEKRNADDPITPGELSDYLGVPDHTAMDVLEGLAANGLARETVGGYRWPN